MIRSVLPQPLSRTHALTCVVVSVLALSGCGNDALLTVNEGSGPQPKLPAPQTSVFPTVNIAKAEAWPEGTRPTAATGLAVTAFATGLAHPRWVTTLPNGDVLVAESDAPPKPEDKNGIKGWVMGIVMKAAGSSRNPSANRITLLRDADGDGVAEVKSVLLTGLNSPFGMAVVGDKLYVANTDAVMVFPYTAGQTRIEAAGQQLVALPAGPINHHWTKNLIASGDGSKLYVTVGSNSNVAEKGMDKEAGRAAIWEVDIATGAHREFATGLRNPNGMGWEPTTQVLWTVANERDELGSDLVPDYLTSVQKDGFYGWPYSYYGQHVDTRVEPPRPDLVAKAISPDYALGPHVAALGLTFATGQQLGAAYASGAFIGEHGSWNRKPRSGYKVVFVPFEGGKPKGLPQDVLVGFVQNDKAYGRPVGVDIDKRGALLVADDVGNTIWRVTAAAR
ncbi:MAG: sorbosone dehydrogenase family protein [Rubrivivax sp.]